MPGYYEQIEDGRWYPTNLRNQREQCCDCGLVHIIDYRVKKIGRRNELEFRVKRDDRATDRIRKRRRLKLSV